MQNGFLEQTNTTPKAESRQQYAHRYLKSKLFTIVQHYNPDAQGNPPIVQEVIDEIIETLLPE